MFKKRVPIYNKKTGLINPDKPNNEVSEITLDKWFSKFIRLRDAMDNGYVACVTCRAIHHWKDMDNGHFQTRNYANTKYHEQNCHTQCTACNKFGTGEQYKHSIYIDTRYGKGKAQELFDLAHSPTRVKMTSIVITEMAKIYRNKVNELLKRIK